MSKGFFFVIRPCYNRNWGVWGRKPLNTTIKKNSEIYLDLQSMPDTGRRRAAYLFHRAGHVVVALGLLGELRLLYKFFSLAGHFVSSYRGDLTRQFNETDRAEEVFCFHGRPRKKLRILIFKMANKCVQSVQRYLIVVNDSDNMLTR